LGAFHEFTCNNCGYKISTSGLWEFYRDDQGNLQDYGHPVPRSREAREKGVYGLYGNFYCPTCDQTQKIICIEAKEPIYDRFDLWTFSFEPIDEYKDSFEIKCPVCNNTQLLLEPDEENPVKCPRCKKGNFELTYEIIS